MPDSEYSRLRILPFPYIFNDRIIMNRFLKNDYIYKTIMHFEKDL